MPLPIPDGARSQELIRSGAHDVQAVALETVGNLAFCRPNRATFLHTPHLRERIIQLAMGEVGAATSSVRYSAIRTLAILGESLQASSTAVLARAGQGHR